MEIKVDTLLMQQMASGSLRAQEYLNQAADAANAITIHDDWNCKERDIINDNVLNIKKFDSKICEKMNYFAEKVNELATQFEEFDKMLSSQFSSFDSSVGDMYQVGHSLGGNAVQFHSISENDIENALTYSGTNTYWEQYHISNLTKPVSVVSYADSAAILEGSAE